MSVVNLLAPPERLFEWRPQAESYAELMALDVPPPLFPFLSSFSRAPIILAAPSGTRNSSPLQEDESSYTAKALSSLFSFSPFFLDPGCDHPARPCELERKKIPSPLPFRARSAPAIATITTAQLSIGRKSARQGRRP